MLRVYYKHYKKYITSVNHVKRQRKNGNSFGWDRALEVRGGVMEIVRYDQGLV